MGIFDIIKQTVTTSAGAVEKTENNSGSISSANSYDKNKKEDVSVFLNTNSFDFDDTDEKGNDILSQLEDSLEDLTDTLDTDSNTKTKRKRTSIAELTQENRETQIIEKADVGEVFKLPNSDKLYIKSASGDYKELNISENTYNKLFKNTNSDKNNKEYNLTSNIEKLFDFPESKEVILNCFSEDEKGNVTITLPNSKHSFTLENGKSLSNYDEFMEDYESNIGVGMIELALGSMQVNKELEVINSNMLFYEETINKEKNNQPQALLNTFNKALEYADGATFLKYEIANYYSLIANGANEEEIRENVSQDICDILDKYPKDKVTENNINYIFSVIYSEIGKQNKEELEINPYYAIDRDYIFDETYMLSTFGLNKNYEPTSNDAFAKAEEYMRTFNFPTTTSFDKNLLATIIDENENGQKIIDYILSQRNTDIYYGDMQTLLNEATKENADIELLKKMSDLNLDIVMGKAIDKNLITNENIDLLTTIQKQKDTITEEEIKGINCILNFLPKEEVEKYLQKNELNTIMDIATYISSILPSNFNDDGTTRSNLLKEEISTYINATLNGQNPEDIAVPTVDSISAGLNNTKIGDVFEVKDENKIYIKTNDNEYQQLDISKDAYNKLFPPIQKYVSSQGDIGDCYLVSTLNNMMTDPSMRHILLNCFSEDENGNITVDLPNGDYTFTVENGKSVLDYFPQEVTVEDFYTGKDEIIPSNKAISDSSLGMQMLEVCYGVYLQTEESNRLIKELEGASLRIEEKEKSFSPDEKNKCKKTAEIIIENINPELDFNSLIKVLHCIDEENIEDIASRTLLPDCDKETLDNFVSLYKECLKADISPTHIAYLFHQNSLSENINNIQNDVFGTKMRSTGGFNEDVFEAFGIECDSSWQIETKDELIELLKNPNIKIVAGGTYGDSDNDMLNKDLNIAERHAYTIRPKKLENGEYQFEVINPWDEAQTSILSMEDIIKYFRHIDYIYT